MRATVRLKVIALEDFASTVGVRTELVEVREKI
jgi:hypothetical protein